MRKVQNGTLRVVLIGVLAAVLVGCIVLLCVLSLDKKDKVNLEVGSSDSTIESNIDSVGGNSSGNTDSVNNSSENNSSSTLPTLDGSVTFGSGDSATNSNTASDSDTTKDTDKDADKATDEDGSQNLSYALNGSGVSVMNYDGESKKVTIPESYNGSIVTAIAKQAFAENTHVEEVIIPSSVTSIGDEAFAGCSNLTEIGYTGDAETWENITKGKDWDKDTGDYKVTDSKGEVITQKQKSCLTFALTDDKQSYVITGYDGTTAEVAIPSLYENLSVTGINANAFVNDGNVTEITFISTEKEWSALTKANGWDNGLTHYLVQDQEGNIIDEKYAYYTFLLNDENTYTLTGYTGTAGEAVIPSTFKGVAVTAIGAEAFANITTLTQVTIPNSVKTIGDNAFNGSLALREIVYAGTLNGWDEIEKTDEVWNANTGDYTVADSNGEILVALHHNWNEWVTEDATCTEKGSRTRSCKNNADHTQTEEIEAKGHDFQDGSCTRCNEPDPNYVETYTDGLIFALNSDNSGYSVSGYNGDSTEIVIPAKYQGLPVTSIASADSVENSVFYKGVLFKGNITSVVIGKNVETIGAYAFFNCTSLMNITIPEGVKTIETSAFNGCAHLTSITIPQSVTSIETDAFKCCYTLVEVYNLSNLTISIGSEDNGHVGYYAKVIHNSLEEKSNLTTTEDGFQFYDDGTNSYLTGYNKIATTLVFPDNFNGKNYEIYQYAFYDRDDLTSVTMSNGVTSIETYAFDNCYNLTSATISSSVTSIGNYAFSSTPKLIEVYDLSSLGITTSGSGNGDLGYYAKVIHNSLNEKSYLTTTEDGLQFYDDGTDRYFMGYNGSKTDLVLPDNFNGNTYEIYKYAFYNCNDLISLTISNGVTAIMNYVFYCDRLTSVSIGSGVTSIGNYTFFHCGSLEEINVVQGNSAYSSVDGVLFNKNQTTLIRCPAKKSGSYTMPSSVTKIVESAFEGCAELTSVTIASNVKFIGSLAFMHCSKLTSVIFQNKSNWKVAKILDSISVDVSNASTAATYLVSTYSLYEWNRG